MMTTRRDISLPASDNMEDIPLHDISLHIHAHISVFSRISRHTLSAGLYTLFVVMRL
jgi:hypothetical protein